MSAAELDLVRSDAAVAGAGAWLVPGADPSEWLAAIAELGLAARAVRVFPLPRSRRDPRAAGVMLVAAEGAGGRSPRALALRRLGRGLHVPPDAELVPPALAGELEALLAGRLALLLPGKLFVAFDESDAVAPLDLVEPPPRRETSWDGASAGLAAATRLVAIDVERPPVAETMAADGGEIATGQLAELPPSPGEPVPKRTWRARLWRTLARAILSLTRRGWSPRPGPKTAPPPGWLVRLGRFAASFLTREIQDERERQLARLLALLESDPDEGLRYALPMLEPGGRGLAPPGAKLEKRTPEYDAAWLAGSGSIDAWDVDPHVRWQLMAHYRRLARRELELGRARRAAYVFAELLGDLRAAAQALESGHHYLEAAELYRERLGDRQAAARCLERGGLLVEALAEWRALGQLEHVAELLARLGRTEEARAVHRERVRHRLHARDRLGAATILERELHAPDEALEVLAGAWPDDPNLEPCLGSYFGLLARQGRHAEAVRFVREHGAALPAPAVREPWMRVLAQLAASPGESELRTLAADAARVLAGQALLESRAGGRALLDALVLSAPRDPLLRRDAVRFAHGLESSQQAHSRQTSAKLRLEPAGDFQVDVGDPRLCCVAATRELLFVFTGEPERGTPRLDAYAWHDGRCVASWRWMHEPALLARGLLHVVPGEHGLRVLALPVASQRRFELVERVLARGGRVTAGTPDWMPPRVRALCSSARGELWVASEDEEGELALSCHGPAGELLGKNALAPLTEAGLDPTELLVRQPSAPVSMAVVGTTVFVAASPLLWRIDEHWHVQRMPWACERVLAPPPFTRELFVMESERGCFLMDPEREALVELCRGATLCCGFLHGGLFAAVHAGEISIARLGPAEARTVLVEPRRGEREQPIGLVAAEWPDELALVGNGGFVQRMRVRDA